MLKTYKVKNNHRNVLYFYFMEKDENSKVCAEFLGNQKLNDENTLFIIHLPLFASRVTLLPYLVP